MSARGRDNAAMKARLAEQLALQAMIAEAQRETARGHAIERRTVRAANNREARFIALQSGADFDKATRQYQERGPVSLDTTGGNTPFEERYVPKKPVSDRRVAEINHAFARIAEQA